MKTLVALIIASTLQARDPAEQPPKALMGFLETQAAVGITSRSLNYRVTFKSARKGKPNGTFQDSGSLIIGTTEKGTAWVSAPRNLDKFLIGELASASEGQRWFTQICGPSHMVPVADPGSFLRKLVGTLPLKDVKNASAGTGDVGSQVLIYQLEAPRPTGRFYAFQSKAGEARLCVRKDGSPSSLEVEQAYEGKVSPHFGLYRLNRKEFWLFSMKSGQIETTKYHLSLRRQDWNESMEGELELALGALQ